MMGDWAVELTWQEPFVSDRKVVRLMDDGDEEEDGRGIEIWNH